MPDSPSPSSSGATRLVGRIPPRLVRWLPPLGALAACVLAAGYATWPLASSLGGNTLFSDVGDPMELAWIMAWFSHAAVHHPLHMFDGNFFFPQKGTLAFTEPFIGISIFVAPLFWITHNALLTANVASLLVYIVGGFGMAFLIHEVTDSWLAGAVAAVAFTVTPYRVITIGHLHVVAIHFVPFVLALLLRVHRKGVRPWTVPVIGALVAIQFWSSLTGAALLLAVVGVWGVWELVTQRRNAIRPLVPAVAGVVLGIVLAAPLLAILANTQRTHPEYKHPADEPLLYAAHARSYLSPAPGGPVVRSLYTKLHNHFVDAEGANEKLLFPGFVLSAVALLTLAAIALAVALRLLRDQRRWPPWAGMVGLLTAVGAVGYVLSLGPRLGAKHGAFPLPYALLSLVPGGLIRVPARFGELVCFALAGILGVLIGHLPRRWRMGAAALVLAALALEAAPHNIVVVRPRLTAAQTTSKELAAGKGAVLALPITVVRPDGTIDESTIATEALQMELSTRHFRPLVNGYAAFFPDSYFEVVRGVQNLPSAPAFALLKARGVTTVVVQNALVVGTPWAEVVPRMEAWPGVQVVSQSAATVVFDVTGARDSTS